MNPDIFFICSVIKTSNNPWYHTHIRSPFTPEERFQQTLHTIETIRNLNDDTKILLVDCSDLDKEMEDTLKSKVDYYIQLYSNYTIRKICMYSRQKGHGEFFQTKEAINFIKENNIEFNRFFKISGRYYLNENFSKNNYSITEFTFRKVAPDTAYTVLYSVPSSLFDTYNNIIDECLKVYKRNDRIGFETLLPMKCNPLHDIEILGVEGFVCILIDNKPRFDKI
jgi:hypothetical protein